MKPPVYTVEIDTPVGAMVAAATDQALCMLEFLSTEARWRGKLGTDTIPASNPIIDAVRRELGEYFAGTRREFTVPLAPAGTPFQKSAWQMLQQIPYGTTRSYGEQARFIGQPTATRAVARANGDNPIAIIVPCHRIIGSNGKLTGYGGGLWRKQWLLDHESGGRLALDGGLRDAQMQVR